MGTCSVCCEPLTKKVRAPVTCLYCTYESCQQCFRRFLLESMSGQCMSCKRPWNAEYVESQVSRAFLRGPYADKRRDVLLGIERAKLPATMDLASRYAEFTRILNRSIRTKGRISEIYKAVSALKRTHGPYVYKKRDDVKALIEERRQLVRAYMADQTRMNVLRWPHLEAVGAGSQVHAPAPTPIFHCPVPNCRGFAGGVSGDACGLCKAPVCQKCRQVAGELHACNPEDVETVRALRKDTKPCPNCAAPIFKIDGCDQMWCLACKTAFSWRTGEIERGRVHNPEYFRWLRENGETIPRVDDGPCQVADQVPTEFVLGRNMRLLNLEEASWQYGLMPALRQIVHVREVTLRNLRLRLRRPGVLSSQFPIEDAEDPYVDLRVQYLLKTGIADEAEWRRRLLNRERQLARVQASVDLYDMFVAAGGSLLQRAASPDHCKDLGDLAALSHELEALRVYFNDSVDRLRVRFQCKMDGVVQPLAKWADV